MITIDVVEDAVVSLSGSITSHQLPHADVGEAYAPVEGMLSPSFVANVDLFIKGELDLAGLVEEYGRRAIAAEASFVQAPEACVPAPALSEGALQRLVAVPKEAVRRGREYLHKVIMRSIVIASLAPEYIRRELDGYRQRCAEQLLDRDFVVLRVALQDGKGVKYDGMLSGRAMNIVAGRLVLRMGGNAEPYEATFASESMVHDEAGFATVQINGPSVGRSEGEATAEGIVRAARVGLLFVEALAEHYRQRRHGDKGKVVLKGFSLGGGALAEAIKGHDFRTVHNDYMVISINTFGRLSDVPGHYMSQFIGNMWLKKVSCAVCSLAKYVLRGVGVELDGIQAADKLSRLEIPQIIVQACYRKDREIVALDDGIIGGDISLLGQLQQRGLAKDKTIVQNVRITPAMVLQQGTSKTQFIHCDVDNHMIRWLLEDFRTPFSLANSRKL